MSRFSLKDVDHAHGGFLRLGTGVQVLEPPELRERIALTAAEPAERYGTVRTRAWGAGPART
ncbi:hypothetical protein ACFW5T_11835, partial [Streptomyces sp. NPDC058766]